MAGVALAHEIAPKVLRCEPALPNFCANIHVGCAGRSKLPTVPFIAAFHPKGVHIAFDDGTGWAVDVSGNGRYTLLRHRGSKDWVRIEKDGRFSQRIYREGGAQMTRGACVYLDRSS